MQRLNDLLMNNSLSRGSYLQAVRLLAITNYFLLIQSLRGVREAGHGEDLGDLSRQSKQGYPIPWAPFNVGAVLVGGLGLLLSSGRSSDT